ncbi:DGQHR domain-containing protein [Pseudomonas capsici]|uniref:DGQHR domain-containing protein n=1 Tax=Pseudomonas capsici TaxID=2810614 RepID=UPI0021F15508|nr:DNA sulfur modification protein DndB [Pseudomonas capsici]MCV4263544.1 DGQHR domain-containing protein [Pseudomonas capsici]
MSKRLVLPCLRGYLGTWITYSCMMRLSDASDLIGFAHELHQIGKLSDKIQRELNEDRAREISDYLINNEDRFFNSLVVAIYDGDPNWHEVESIRPNTDEASCLEIPEYAENCLGFLSITREEKFFALDGQHRLAGIKSAVKNNEQVGEDLISVIIVAHSNTSEGKIRSRRLFTTLNKKARLVSKDAIIALDEDDISACITRAMIESDEYPWFNEDNVSFSSGPVRDGSSITSIVNIYDNVQKIVAHKLGVRVSDLDRYRYKGNEQVLQLVVDFFKYTFTYCLELSRVFNNKASVSDYRGGDDGGHLLFRPVGWDLYTEIIVGGLESNSIEMGVMIKNILRKDLYLGGSILTNKIWSPKQKKLLKLSARNQKIIARELLS